MSLRELLRYARLVSMKITPIPMPYIPHENRKAQKLKERVLKILATKAQGQQQPVSKSA